jgi:hypothetical protein
MVAVRAAAGPGIDPAAVRARALELGVLGWVRPTGELHAEGAPDAVDALVAALGVVGEPVRVEGHEQFAIRGVPAGEFVVLEGYELQLEVGGAMRAWALRKEPTLDPAVKRLALEREAPGAGEVWDRGPYEQGGRVAWPQALERGHAVFVLHGAKLRGGFALQRTRPGQWLLVKRRDDEARPG